MAHLHLNELSLICVMWLNKITYLLTYLRMKLICVLVITELTVFIRSDCSFCRCLSESLKYNKTLNVSSLGKPVSFVLPRVLMFPSKNRILGKTKVTVSLGI